MGARNNAHKLDRRGSGRSSSDRDRQPDTSQVIIKLCDVAIKQNVATRPSFRE